MIAHKNFSSSNPRKQTSAFTWSKRTSSCTATWLWARKPVLASKYWTLEWFVVRPASYSYIQYLFSIWAIFNIFAMRSYWSIISLWMIGDFLNLQLQKMRPKYHVILHSARYPVIYHAWYDSPRRNRWARVAVTAVMCSKSRPLGPPSNLTLTSIALSTLLHQLYRTTMLSLR